MWSGGQHNHVPLTAKGIGQATLLGKRLAFDRIRFDHVYTSTAVRAMRTAEIALHNAGLANESAVEHNPALLEQNQGEWEGLERKHVYTPEVHKDMLDLHMDFTAPGGESLRVVQQRAMTFMATEVERWRQTSIKENRQHTFARSLA